MGLFIFIIISAVYIMTIHFAMGIRDWFEVYLMMACFVLGGVVGWWMKSYEMGLVIGIVLSLLFW